MKKLLWIPLLLIVSGFTSCGGTRSTSVNFPPNTLVECPEIKKLIIDEKVDGVRLKDYYIARGELNSQYADCATIHNELVRFIKSEQNNKKKK